MKAKIKEIREWYNENGKLFQHTILYESGRSVGCFENLPKNAKKWMENAEMVRKFNSGNWTCKIYKEKA